MIILYVLMDSPNVLILKIYGGNELFDLLDLQKCHFWLEENVLGLLILKMYGFTSNLMKMSLLITKYCSRYPDSEHFRLLGTFYFKRQLPVS